jgi:hypothetical protein
LKRGCIQTYLKPNQIQMKTKSHVHMEGGNSLSTSVLEGPKLLALTLAAIVLFGSLCACHTSSGNPIRPRFSLFDLILLALWACFAVVAYLVFRKYTPKSAPPPEAVVVDWSLTLILAGAAVVFMGALIGAAAPFYPKVAQNVIVPSVIAVCGLVTAAAIFTAFRPGQTGDKKKAIKRLCLFLLLLVCLTAAGLFWELDSK